MHIFFCQPLNSSVNQFGLDALVKGNLMVIVDRGQAIIHLCYRIFQPVRKCALVIFQSQMLLL